MLAASYDANHVGRSIAVLNTPDDKEVFLVGAPHRLRETLSGHVLVYGIRHTRTRYFWDGGRQELWNITSADFENGAQMGEQFGHAIATGDFNGDGLMDYAVSAPTWTDQTVGKMKVDIGRVYIFIAQAEETEAGDSDDESFSFSNFDDMTDDDEEDLKTGANQYKPSMYLEGVGKNGQFGFSLASVDLNEDGVDDLVVSAPFENDEQGNVYIFNGKKDADDVFDKVPTQTLNEDGAKWFGHSVSARADVDANEYNDIAVGAPKSEDIFMYRTRPSVQLYINGT